MPEIWILPTTAYFRVENVHINGTTDVERGGVHLYNVTNGNIINVTVTNSWTGPMSEKSEFNKFIGNNATKNSYGIILSEPDNSTPIENTVANNTESGIYLSSTHFSINAV